MNLQGFCLTSFRKLRKYAIPKIFGEMFELTCPELAGSKMIRYTPKRQSNYVLVHSSNRYKFLSLAWDKNLYR